MKNELKQFINLPAHPHEGSGGMAGRMNVWGISRFEQTYNTILPIIIHNMQLTGGSQSVELAGAVQVAMELTRMSLEAIQNELKPDKDESPGNGLSIIK